MLQKVAKRPKWWCAIFLFDFVKVQMLFWLVVTRKIKHKKKVFTHIPVSSHIFFLIFRLRWNIFFVLKKVPKTLHRQWAHYATFLCFKIFVMQVLTFVQQDCKKISPDLELQFIWFRRNIIKRIQNLSD